MDTAEETALEKLCNKLSPYFTVAEMLYDAKTPQIIIDHPQLGPILERALISCKENRISIYPLIVKIKESTNQVESFKDDLRAKIEEMIAEHKADLKGDSDQKWTLEENYDSMAALRRVLSLLDSEPKKKEESKP